MDKKNELLQDLLHKLSAAENPVEQATIAAEFCLDGLPEETAHIARACALFHWFDESVIEALLQLPLTVQPEADRVYEQIRELPFVETLPWGARFQDPTRKGLLQRYKQTQPELLQQAAVLATSAYEHRLDDKKVAAELLFCSIVAGEQEASTQLLQTLQEWAHARSDWHYLGGLLDMQEEAESFPFVRPLPVDADAWLLRGLVAQARGELEQAISDFTQAIALNPKNALAYVHCGTAYDEHLQSEKALAYYTQALLADPDLTVALAARGSVLMRLQDYPAALSDFNAAIQHHTEDPTLHHAKGTLLSILGDKENALAELNEVLRLDSYNAHAYCDKGTILNEQGKYQEALTAFDASLELDRYNPASHWGKGTALIGLKQYEQASRAYEEAEFVRSVHAKPW